MHKLRVGYTCNIRDNCKAEDERYSEWEPPETVEAVVTALVDAGCEVSVIDIGPDIFHMLERRRSELDLIFNNAEGLEEGELREAIGTLVLRAARDPAHRLHAEDLHQCPGQSHRETSRRL
jgi:D-alanine-D-alanine ligase